MYLYMVYIIMLVVIITFYHTYKKVKKENQMKQHAYLLQTAARRKLSSRTNIKPISIGRPTKNANMKYSNI